jgi:hypothetical protein
MADPMSVLIRFAVLWALLVAGLLAMAGCQRSEVRYSESLDRSALMALRFPGWGPSAKVQSVDMSALENRSKSADMAATRAEVTPLYVVKLDDTHAALVSQVLPVGDDGAPMDCHACSGAVGAYFFEHSASGWRMSARQDAVLASGVGGSLGNTKITKLGDTHFAFTVEWGSCWQGYCGTWLDYADLRIDKASPQPGIRLSVENDGAHGACSALAAPKGETPEDVDDLGPHECLDIQSTWRFQGNRLLVAFEGRLSQLDKSGQLQPTQKIRQQAVYEATPGKLALVSGSNPIPGF